MMESPIRAVLVDDEPPARDRIRWLLRAEPDVALVAECEDAASAAEAITRERPDLLFLDIRLPGADGMALLQRLGQATPPHVIFVTAYDDYAVRAFDLHATDYLLKPFDPERFHDALERVRRARRAPGPHVPADRSPGAEEPMGLEGPTGAGRDGRSLAPVSDHAAARPLAPSADHADGHPLAPAADHAAARPLAPAGDHASADPLGPASDHAAAHPLAPASSSYSLAPAPVRYLDRIAVRTGGRVLLLPVDELDWIEAEGNYARLHAGGASYLVRETMAALEAALDPARFARIHRSTIVNVERIRELHPLFHGEYVVVLRTGARLTLSRGYRERLHRRWGRAL